MTRIIAGAARGRRLAVPPRGTRPTSDRVREALFSSLVARVDFEGCAVLDLYAGSGALGLEALSRGASRAVLVDQGAPAVAVAKGNAKAAGLPGVRVIKAAVSAYLGRTPEAFNLVLMDPPYDVPSATVDAELATLAEGWLAPGACVVVERSTRTAPIAWPAGFDVDLARDYGETRIELAFWQDQQA